MNGRCPESCIWILATGRKWWGFSSPVLEDMEEAESLKKSSAQLSGYRETFLQPTRRLTLEDFNPKCSAVSFIFLWEVQ